MNKRLQEIMKKNAEWEEESPYNFCDRWCERCPHEKQVRCKLYLDEFERKTTCIAYGKDEDDPQITEAVMKEQYKEVDEKLSEQMDKFGIDLDNPYIDEKELNKENAVDFEDLPPEIQKHIRFVENNPLDAAAKKYLDKAHTFLESTFYKNEPVSSKLKYDFETISWYHTLLPVKLNRALAGFHEPVGEDEFALYDAVAQFQICVKAVKESIKALRKLKEHFPARRAQMEELIALLHNLDSRIKIMVENI